MLPSALTLRHYTLFKRLYSGSAAICARARNNFCTYSPVYATCLLRADSNSGSQLEQFACASGFSYENIIFFLCSFWHAIRCGKCGADGSLMCMHVRVCVNACKWIYIYLLHYTVFSPHSITWVEFVLCCQTSNKKNMSPVFLFYLCTESNEKKEPYMFFCPIEINHCSIDIVAWKNAFLNIVADTGARTNICVNVAMKEKLIQFKWTGNGCVCCSLCLFCFVLCFSFAVHHS